MLTYKKTMSVILLVAMLISILSMSGIAFAEDGGEDTGAEGTDLISELDNDQDVIPSDSTEDNEKMSDDIPDPVEESMTDEGTNGSEETGDSELPAETENDSLPENAENDPSGALRLYRR